METQEDVSKKIWPLFMFAGMLVLAGFFWLQDVFSSNPENDLSQKDNNQIEAPPDTVDLRKHFTAVSWSLFDEADQSSSEGLPQFRAYKESELLIDSKEQAVTLRQYAEDLAYALTAFTDKNQPSEAEALLHEYENGDGAGLAILAERRDTHLRTTEALLGVTVPKSLAGYHLAIVNSTSRMNYLAENMLLVNENPLLALTSGRIFNTEGNRFIEHLTRMNGALASRGIRLEERVGATLYINASTLP